jgi:hypothetical protein
MTVATGEAFVLWMLECTDSCCGDEESSSGTVRSIAELLETMGTDGTRLGGADVAAAVDSVVGSELVERVGSTDDGPVSIRCTDWGRERAREVKDGLLETTIELVEGSHRERLTIEEAAAELGQSPIEIALGCTDDGRYYPGKQRQSLSTETVGRDSEYKRWRRNLERVRRERSGLGVLLAGPGGIGKTALAERFLQDARAEGWSVTRAWCRGETDEPARPVRELLRRPEIAGTQSMESEADSNVRFETVTERLSPGADEPPRLCYLEDLHLADDSTFRFLQFLIERLPALPMVVLASARPSELPADAPVGVGALPEDAPVLRFDLDPLGREGTRAIVQRVVHSRDVPESFVAAVLKHTGGNPLFVAATVEMLLETGEIDRYFEWHPVDEPEIELPDTVLETVSRRVETLDDATLGLLRWAAVGERTIPVSGLEAVAQRSPGRLRTTVEVLVEAGVFDWQGTSRRLTFRSDLVREALLAGLDAEERRRRRGELARALESEAGDAGTGCIDDGTDPARRASGER